MHKLLVGLLLLTGAAPSAQSGRGLLHGYVAWEDVSYNVVGEGKVHATIELKGSTQFNSGALYQAKTNERGTFDIPAIGMGEYTLKISSAGYADYVIALYIPSDFECRLAIMLKRPKPGS